MTLDPTSQTAHRAADFDQSIGVNTHITATTGGYADITQVIADLAYINVTDVRNRAPSVSGLAPFTALGEAGIQFDLIIQSTPATALAALNALAPYVATVEGRNEVNESSISYVDSAHVTLTGAAADLASQADLYTMVHSDPLLNGSGKITPVLNFSVAVGGNYAPYGNDAADADYTNVHMYGEEGVPSYWFVGPEIAAATDTPALPVIVTETGNYTMLDGGNGVSEDVQAKLIMDTLLDDFKRGVVKTYIYQLLDPDDDSADTNSEEHYGLFNHDGTPKIAATAVHNLTTILSDTGSDAATFKPTPLTYAVSGLPSAGYQFAMEKSDGAYDIALWREPWIWNSASNSEVSYGSITVTVTLGQVYQTINIYDPLVGSAPIATYHNVSTVSVALGTGALVVEVEPDSAVTSNVVNTGSAGGMFTSSGSESIIGGAGAATVNAGNGDTITGSTGNLTALLAASGVSVIGGAGALAVTDSAGANTVTGGTGGLSLTASADGDVVTTNGTGSAVLFTGTGSDTVVANGATSIFAPHANLTVSGDGDLSINGGLGNITLNGGSGSDYIFTQPGTKNLLTLGAGKETILSHGADTINAGSGSDGIYAGGNALINGGTGRLSVSGHNGAITVNGATGTVHASASSGGGYLQGGSNGNNVLSASAGNTTLVGGGDGDTLTDTSVTGSNTLIAGSGSETLTGGSGSDLFVLTQSSVAHSEVIQGFTSGSDYLHFVGFGETQPIAAQQIVGGNLRLTLADNAQVTLVGITSLNSSVIV